jgi:hypothetical protein
MLVVAIRDEAGNRIFADEDAALLATKNYHALARILAVANRLNAMGTEAEAAIRKN